MKFTPWPQEEELVSSENSASIFNTLSDLPSQLRDGPAVLGEAMRLAGALSQETLEAHRHKHLAYILNEQAQLNNGNNATLNANLNKVSRCSLCKVSVLKYQLFLSETKQAVWGLCVSHMWLGQITTDFFIILLKMVKNEIIYLACICSGGEETVATQEVHPELPAVWGGWGRGPEIQEH